MTVTTLPDGNTVQNTYSGNVFTITDQVNRKIQRQAAFETGGFSVVAWLASVPGQIDMALMGLAINVTSRLLQIAYNYGKAVVKTTWHYFSNSQACWKSYFAQGGIEDVGKIEPFPWEGLH